MPQIKKAPLREVRAYSSEVRASPVPEDGGGLHFTGYAAMFNVWSEDLGGFRERIAPGAFAQAIQIDDIRALHNHNPDYVLGRNRSGTLILQEDNKGLHFDVMAPNAQWARDLHMSVERGDVNQCSFSFRVIRDEWRTVDGQDERTLLEVRLFDVSIVTYPAYEATEASARDAFSAHKESLVPRQSGVNAIYSRKLDLKEKEF
ncbi:MAG: HK97 family phage prohead protease [Clostridia bacterium]|nr:HK97 family phage prohead protease [Clostridia bacterium]